MPKPSGKINGRERQICARLKEFRERIRCSQSDLASQLGITRDQLAGIEYARTPLRYDIAWKMRTLFGVSLEWLSVGEMSPNSACLDELPSPESSGLPPTALLSQVSDKVHGPVPEEGIASGNGKRRPEVKLDAVDVAHRAILLLSLKAKMEDVCARIPHGYTGEFGDRIYQLAKKYLEALPKEPEEVVEARAAALMYDEIARVASARGVPLMKKKGLESLQISASDSRASVVAKLESLVTGQASQPPPLAEAALEGSPHTLEIVMDKLSKALAAVEANNKSLTHYVLSSKTADVQSNLPKLISRLRKATTERGSKTKLAAWLGVSPQCVTDWLSGRNEPGGETTLRLLAWVTVAEAKQTKSPAGASTPTEPKAQVRKSYEKKPNPSPP